MKTILVIDDDHSVRTFVDKALRPRFEVMTASDGQSGLDTALATQPHLILCDVNMKGVDGYATLFMLRQSPLTRETPFIFMTGEASGPGMRHGMELGADDYLPKPFVLQQLLATIDTRLAKHEGMRDQAEQKFRKLQKTFANSIPNQLLAPMDNLLVLTELIGKGYRAFDVDEIVAMSRDAHRVATRVRQQIENCLLLAELVLLAEEPDRPSQWRGRRMVHVLDIIQPTAAQKAKQIERGTDLRVSYSYCQANIHPSSLQKIVEEILDNAFKFSKPGTPVEVRVFSSDGRSTIQITDHGSGIAPDEIAKLGGFIRFEQKLVEAHGCGLGLAIAKGLTELNDGHFSIRPGQNGGTIVQIVFPALSNVN
jgi:two-component system sensor histidine kinase/response regulator